MDKEKIAKELIRMAKSLTAQGYDTMTIEVKIHTPLTVRDNPKMLALQVDKRLGQIMRGTPVRISNIVVKDFTDEEAVLSIDFYSDPNEVMKALRGLKLAKDLTAAPVSREVLKGIQETHRFIDNAEEQIQETAEDYTDDRDVLMAYMKVSQAFTDLRKSVQNLGNSMRGLG